MMSDEPEIKTERKSKKSDPPKEEVLETFSKKYQEYEAPAQAIPEKRYKMNLYTTSGLLRPELARGTFTTMSTRYGDIIRSISMNHWCTFEEIVAAYSNLSKRLKFEIRRTPSDIEAAITTMIEAGMIEVK